jgi:hypothetical protein
METIVAEIERAVATLQLPSGAMEQLPPGQSEDVYFAALRHFVSSGDRRWWWEAFRNPGTSVAFEEGNGWRHIPTIVPNPHEAVWFIAEEDQLPHYPVFETTPHVASKVIGECYAFEYYVVAKDLSWLLCENHHNVMCAVGPSIEQRLLQTPSPASGYRS